MKKRNNKWFHEQISGSCHKWASNTTPLSKASVQFLLIPRIGGNDAVHSHHHHFPLFYFILLKFLTFPALPLNRSKQVLAPLPRKCKESDWMRPLSLLHSDEQQKCYSNFAISWPISALFIYGQFHFQILPSDHF